MPTQITLENDGLSTVRSNRAAFAASKSRQTVIRSKILRNLNKKNNSLKAPRDHLSSTDIRASPRMVGYIYILVASSVMVASVVQLYINYGDNVGLLDAAEIIQIYNKGGTVDASLLTNQVQYWKLFGALVVSCVGCFVSLFVLLAHFDTLLCPSIWRRIFKDGSNGEGVFLVVFSLFWMVGLYINTSTFSIAFHDPNVYFTSWICLISSGLNYDAWRSGSDKRTFHEWIKENKCPTTHNWVICAVFLFIFAISVTDMYLYRGNLVLFAEGQIIEPNTKEWPAVLGISWSFAFLSLFCLYASETFTWALPICPMCCGLDWRIRWSQIEGVILGGMVCTTGWAANRYSGVNAPIDRIGNAYFGVWGAFFSLLIALGTWMRENRSLLPTRSYN